MSITRIQNNQITDSTIVAYAKLQSGSLTGNLFAPTVTLNSNVTINGNLFLANTGNTVTLNATNTFVNDPLVVFNNGYAGSLSGYDIGILVNRNLSSLGSYGSVNTAWVWVENDQAFEAFTTTDIGTGQTSLNNSGFANTKVGNSVVVGQQTTGSLTVSGAAVFNGSATFNGTTTLGALTGSSFQGVVGNVTPNLGYFTTVTATTVNAATIGNIGANHVGTGTYLTSLNASNLSSGTVPSAQISGAYTGITQVGTLTGLTVSGTTALNTVTGASFQGAIGNATPNTGAFTTLTASGVTQVTNSTAATNTTSGALQVTGGAGVQGSLYAASVFDNGNRVLTSLSSTGTGNLTVSISAPAGSTIALPATGPGATTWGGATQLHTMSVDAYGRVSAASNIALNTVAVTNLGNTSEITANSTVGLTGLNLTTTGVTAGNYGSATAIPTIVVDSKGRVTSITTNSASTSFTVAGTSGTASVAAGSTLSFASTNGVTIAVGATYANISTPQDLRTTANPAFNNATLASLQATAIGNVTPGTGAFTTLTAQTETVGGLQAVAIGNVTPGTGVFTTGTFNTATTGGLQAVAIGNVTPGTAVFTTLTAQTETVGGLQAVAIGNVTPGTAVFTTETVGGLQAVAIGNVTPGTGVFTTGTFNTATTGGLQAVAIGNATPGTGAFTTLTASGITQVTNNTNNSGTTASSGALQVTGGAGFGGNVYVGGNLIVQGNIYETSTEIITGNEIVAGVITANSGTASTSTTTGALLVNGGAGVTGAIYAGSFQGPIGTVAPAAGTLTTLTVTGASTLNTVTGASFQGVVGNVTPNNGFFTTVTATTVNAATIGNTGATLTGTLSTAAQTSVTSVGTLTGLSVSGITTITNATNNSGLTYSSGALQVTGGAGFGGNVYIGGNAIVAGNINLAGNVNSVTITGNSGQFFGNAAGFGALYTGISSGFVFQPQTVLQNSTNFNGYAQINHQNINGGSLASGDYVVTANNGSANDTYIDMGMASSTYNYPGFGLLRPNDGYLLVYGNTTTKGGNLVLGAGGGGLDNDIIFAVGGFDTTNEYGRIDGTGNIFVIKSAVASTSSTTGAMTIAGGLGVAGAVNVGSTLGVTGTATHSGTTNLVGATTFTTATGGGLQAVAIGNATPGTGAFTTLSASGITSVTNSTASTTYSNGALVVTGGVGIAGAVNTNANIAIGGTTPGLITPAGSNSNLIIDPDGAGNVYISANTFINYTSPSTSTTTGALVVGGGVGVAGNLNVGTSGTSIHQILGNLVVGYGNGATGAQTALVVNQNNATPFNSTSALHVFGTAGATAKVTLDAVGTAIPSYFIARSASGTAASPTAATNGQTLGGFIARGYGATGFLTSAPATGMIIKASQNFTDTAQGSHLDFNVTPLNSNSAVTAMTIETTGVIYSNVAIPSTSATTGSMVIVGSGGLGIGGNINIGANATVNGNTTMTGNAYVSGQITSFNSTNTVNSSTGALVLVNGGIAVSNGNINVAGQLFVGATSQSTVLTSPITVERGTSLSGPGSQYTQHALINSTNTGSSDFIAYPNNYPGPSNDHGWSDLGFTGDAFSDPVYSITKSNDGYFFASGANTSVGGNLVLATDYTGGYNDIVLGVGSFYANSEVARFHGNTSNNGTFVLKLPTNNTQTANTGAFQVWGGESISGNSYIGGAVTVNGSQTSNYDFKVRGVNTTNILWARPNSTYDTVIVGNTIAATSIVNGARLYINSTDSFVIPTGTTAQRPSNQGFTDVAGMLRYNTTTNGIEFYNGTNWQAPSSTITVITDQQFTATGSTAVFTLSGSATTAATIVSINGVLQIPTLAYSVSGTTLTFTENPASGDIIDVRVLTTTTTVSQLNDATGFNSVQTSTPGVGQVGVLFTTGYVGGAATSQYGVDTAGGFVTLSPNVTVATSSIATVVDALFANSYSSAEYTITATIQGTNIRQIDKVHLIHNGDATGAGTATITVYGTVNTAGNSLVSYTSATSGNIAQLKATTTNNNTILRIKRNYQAI